METSKPVSKLAGGAGLLLATLAASPALGANREDRADAEMARMEKSVTNGLLSKDEIAEGMRSEFALAEIRAAFATAHQLHQAIVGLYVEEGIPLPIEMNGNVSNPDVDHFYVDTFGHLTDYVVSAKGTATTKEETLKYLQDTMAGLNAQSSQFTDVVTAELVRSKNNYDGYINELQNELDRLLTAQEQANLKAMMSRGTSIVSASSLDNFETNVDDAERSSENMDTVRDLLSAIEQGQSIDPSSVTVEGGFSSSAVTAVASIKDNEMVRSGVGKFLTSVRGGDIGSARTALDEIKAGNATSKVQIGDNVFVSAEKLLVVTERERTMNTTITAALDDVTTGGTATQDLELSSPKDQIVVDLFDAPARAYLMSANDGISRWITHNGERETAGRRVGKTGAMTTHKNGLHEMAETYNNPLVVLPEGSDGRQIAGSISAAVDTVYESLKAAGKSLSKPEDTVAALITANILQGMAHQLPREGVRVCSDSMGNPVNFTVSEVGRAICGAIADSLVDASSTANKDLIQPVTGNSALAGLGTRTPGTLVDIDKEMKDVIAGLAGAAVLDGDAALRNAAWRAAKKGEAAAK